MAKIHFSTAVGTPDALTVLESRQDLTDRLLLQPTVIFFEVEVTSTVYQTINKNQIVRIEE